MTPQRFYYLIHVSATSSWLPFSRWLIYFHHHFVSIRFINLRKHASQSKTITRLLIRTDERRTVGNTKQSNAFTVCPLEHATLRCAVFSVPKKIHKIRWILIKNGEENTHVKLNFNYLSLAMEFVELFSFEHCVHVNFQRVCSFTQKIVESRFFAAVAVVLLFKY